MSLTGVEVATDNVAVVDEVVRTSPFVLCCPAFFVSSVTDSVVVLWFDDDFASEKELDCSFVVSDVGVVDRVCWSGFDDVCEAIDEVTLEISRGFIGIDFCCAFNASEGCCDFPVFAEVEVVRMTEVLFS
jgi:hypothetical protein